MNRTLMALALTGSAFVGDHALADQVSIKSLTYAGSGCFPSSRVTGRLIDLDKDGLPDRLDLAFPNYVAKLAPASPS